MDDLAAKYTRALDQVRRKDEELKALLKDANALDAAKTTLEQELSESRSRVRELETHAARIVSRNGQLEDQVKSLQLKLQAYLDAETDAALERSRNAASAGGRSAGARSASGRDASDGNQATGAAAPTPRRVFPAPAQAVSPSRQSVDREKQQLESRVEELNASVRGLEAEVSSLEAARAAAADAAANFKEGAELLENKLVSVDRELQDARRDAAADRDHFDETIRAMEKKEAALQNLIHQLQERQRTSMSEAAKMEEIEVKAKEGMRNEWLSAIAECERLSRVAENSNVAAEEARSEHERVVQQLEAQRAFINDSNELSAKEMRALRLENDILLEDLKAAIDERDAARLAVAKGIEAAKRSAEVTNTIASSQAVRATIGIVSIDSAAQTDADTDNRVSRPVTPPPPPAAAAAASSAAVDAAAMADLETAALEWKEIAEGARQELSSSQARFDAALRAREMEAVELGSKAQEVARKLHAAYTEIDRLYAELRARDDAAARAPATSGAKADGSGARRASSSRAAESALELLAGAEPPSSASDASSSFAADALQIADDALKAAVQAHYLATSPPGVRPTRRELDDAAEHQPIVPSSRYASPELNELFSKLGGIRHITKALRSELWSSFGSSGGERRQPHVPTHDPSVSSTDGDADDNDTAPAGSGPRARSSDAVSFRPRGPNEQQTTFLRDSSTGAGRPGVSAALREYDDVAHRSVSAVSQPQSSRGSTPPPPPVRLLNEGADDDVQRLLAENDATLRALSGQMQWQSTRMATFRGSIDALKSQGTA